ncbi:hypothetical protein [Bartonella quintana]|nr:hypothetical protein [Bartonella quintana]
MRFFIPFNDDIIYHLFGANTYYNITLHVDKTLSSKTPLRT